MSVSADERNCNFVNFAVACVGNISHNVRRIDFAMDAVNTYRMRVVLRKESRWDRWLMRMIREGFEEYRSGDYRTEFKIDCEIIIVNDGPVPQAGDDEGYVGLYVEHDKAQGQVTAVLENGAADGTWKQQGEWVKSVSVSERNGTFMAFAQACLGYVSRNMRRVDFAVDGGNAYRARFVLGKDAVHDRAMIGQMIENFKDAHNKTHDPGFKVDCEIIINDGLARLPGYNIGYLSLYRQYDPARE